MNEKLTMTKLFGQKKTMTKFKTSHKWPKKKKTSHQGTYFIQLIFKSD